MTTSPLFIQQIAAIVAMVPRVQWLLVNQRAVLDHNTLWGDAKIGRYARIVDGLVAPLARSGRHLQAVCFRFNSETHLLVVHRGMRLCFVLPPKFREVDQIANAGMALLRDCEADIHEVAGIEYEPEDDFVETVAEAETLLASAVEPTITWPEFRTFLLEVLGKILSRPQAERLLERELSAPGIPAVPESADFERIGRSVVAHVPHRGKQAALLAELLYFLEIDS